MKHFPMKVTVKEGRRERERERERLHTVDQQYTVSPMCASNLLVYGGSQWDKK